jgi:hypothetical protein
MPSVDAYGDTIGEYLVALGVLCFKLESWTEGIAWGILSCVFGFMFPCRRRLSEGLLLCVGTPESRGHQEECVNGGTLCVGMPHG